jgi:anti-anti-sigma regulatory factor
MIKKRPRRATQPRHLVLAERLSIVQAIDLHQVLAARVLTGAPIVIDGTRVEDIDTSILQMLASLWRTSHERGIACTWHGASDILRRRAAVLGLSELLQLSAGESARP